MKKIYLILRLLQKSQMSTLPNPSRRGRGLFINPLPWRERARVRGVMDFCKSLTIKFIL